MPKSRLEFWQLKLEKNKIRDRENVKRLKAQGWQILVIWECQTENGLLLENKIIRFMEPSL